MNSDSITITRATLKSLPKAVREAIITAIFGQEVANGDALLDDGESGLAELSPNQAREFYAGCGEKTRKALEVIASSESRQFHLADVAKAIGTKPDDLRGVWGGLTRRLYTITGSDEGYLIDWHRHDPIDDENGDYVDHIGEVSELTYQSFRKVLSK